MGYPPVPSATGTASSRTHTCSPDADRIRYSATKVLAELGGVVPSLEHALHIVGVQLVLPPGGLVEPRLRGETQELLDLRADVVRGRRDRAGVRIPHVGDGRHSLDDRAVPVLGLLEPLLGLLLAA